MCTSSQKWKEEDSECVQTQKMDPEEIYMTPFKHR